MKGQAVAILAAVAMLAAGSGHAGGPAASPCQSALPRTRLDLPAPVIVTTNCGRFRLGPAGRVVYLGPRTLPVPRGASYWADLTWTRFARGHLLVGRGHQQLWRSHRTYPHTYPANIGVVVLGRHELAFSYYRGRRPLLYLARYGANERALTGGELPLVFLRSGEFVTWRDRGGALVLRTASGRVERLIAPHAANPLVDRRGTILFRVADRLRVFDGHRVRSLASLRSLGLTGQPLIELLGRLVAIRNERLLVVLDLDGRRLASTRLPQRRRPVDMVSSPVVANPAGTAVAFAAARGTTAYGSRGRETVYLLRAGEHQARPLYSEPLQFKGCERAANLAWHDHWLLYSATEERAALIDSSLQARPVELSNLIARLPGAHRSDDAVFDASWDTWH